MRDLSKQFSDKMLRNVLKQLEDAFHYEYNGYSMHQRYEEGYCDIVDGIVKYYGLHDLEWEEYGFFFQLMELNPDYRDENKQIKVPKLGMYDVYYDSEERLWVTYTYKHRVYGYGRDMVRDQLNNSTDFEYYDGQIINESVDDSEVVNGRIIDVEEVKKDRN
jgi:hypothetical protein